MVYKTPYSLLPQNFPELSHSHCPPGLHCPGHTGLLTTPGLSRHPLASGPLCLLFSLPRCSSPKCLRGSLAYLLKVFTQMVTLTQGFHWQPFKNYTHKSCLPGSHNLYSTYSLSTHCMFYLLFPAYFFLSAVLAVQSSCRQVNTGLQPGPPCLQSISSYPTQNPPSLLLGHLQ